MCYFHGYAVCYVVDFLFKHIYIHSLYTIRKGMIAKFRALNGDPSIANICVTQNTLRMFWTTCEHTKLVQHEYLLCQWASDVLSVTVCVRVYLCKFTPDVCVRVNVGVWQKQGRGRRMREANNITLHCVVYVMCTILSASKLNNMCTLIPGTEPRVITCAGIYLFDYITINGKYWRMCPCVCGVRSRVCVSVSTCEVYNKAVLVDGVRRMSQGFPLR